MERCISQLQFVHKDLLSSADSRESVLSSKQSIVDSLLNDNRALKEESRTTAVRLNQEISALRQALACLNQKMEESERTYAIEISKGEGEIERSSLLLKGLRQQLEKEQADNRQVKEQCNNSERELKQFQ